VSDDPFVGLKKVFYEFGYHKFTKILNACVSLVSSCITLLWFHYLKENFSKDLVIRYSPAFIVLIYVSKKYGSASLHFLIFTIATADNDNDVYLHGARKKGSLFSQRTGTSVLVHRQRWPSSTSFDFEECFTNQSRHIFYLHNFSRLEHCRVTSFWQSQRMDAH
jgi:hypothetical protein